MLLVRFQDGYEKDITSNQLTEVAVDSFPVIKEDEVSTIYVIPDETVDFDKGYYHGIYYLLQFNKGGGIDSKQDQEYMYPYQDEDRLSIDKNIKFSNQF